MDVSTLNVRVCKMAGKNMHNSKNNNSSHEDNILQSIHKDDILNSSHEDIILYSCHKDNYSTQCIIIYVITDNAFSTRLNLCSMTQINSYL